MRLSVFCMVLCLGVVAFARPEGEASAVANPAPAEGEAAADPKPDEQVPSEEDEAARSKRWYHYYYYPNSFNFGYGRPWGYNHFLRSGGGPSGRTRGNPYSATFNELMDHQRWNEYNHQQWLNNQQNFGNNPQNFGNNQFDRNLPDVIDTAALNAADAAEVESRTRVSYANPSFNGFHGNYPHNFNSNFGQFGPNFNQGPYPYPGF